jgi:addiction module HigA family antidote
MPLSLNGAHLFTLDVKLPLGGAHGPSSIAIHPGEILADELQELGVTPTELSRLINVPPNRVTQIIHARRDITADTALRLARISQTIEVHRGSDSEKVVVAQ